MLPYLLAERAPLWDPSLTGAFLGVRHDHSRGHFIRAAIEGVALQLATIVQELHRVEPLTSVRATGGMFRSPLWRSVMAAVLEHPLSISGDAEGSALGAAALGLLATQRAGSLSAAVDLLAPGLRAGPGDVVAVSAADRKVYEQLRVDITRVLSAYEDVAGLFARDQ